MAARRIDWLAWWQLLRFANVFTAISNVIAGFLLVQQEWQPLGPLFLLVLSSVCLYEAGMVLNDVFDAELDAVERPERPIPSGRIHKRNALRVGLALLVTGILAAFLASVLRERIDSLLIAIALTLAILLYDAWSKQTRWGPLSMATCRALNVLLGASVAFRPSEGAASAFCLALGIGWHTHGLTQISRSEAATVKTSELSIGITEVIVGLGPIAGLALLIQGIAIPLTAWIVICVLLLTFELLLAKRLLRNPTQTVIRKTVGALITLFIVLDAAASSLAAGWWAGLGVLVLLVPVRILSRWTGQT